MDAANEMEQNLQVKKAVGEEKCQPAPGVILDVRKGIDLIRQKSGSFPFKGEKLTQPWTCSCALLNVRGDGTISSVEGCHLSTFSPRQGGVHIRRKWKSQLGRAIKYSHPKAALKNKCPKDLPSWK